MRLLVRRVIRLTHRNVNGTAAGVSGRSGRCFSDAAEDRSTHFGFETVPETEKAKRGELQHMYPLMRSRLLCEQNNKPHSKTLLFKRSLPFREQTHRERRDLKCFLVRENMVDNAA